MVVAVVVEVLMGGVAAVAVAVIASAVAAGGSGAVASARLGVITIASSIAVASCCYTDSFDNLGCWLLVHDHQLL